MSFYVWKDIDALDYVSRLKHEYPSYANKPISDLLKDYGFYKLPGGSVGYFNDLLHPPVSGYEVLVVPQTPSIPNPEIIPEIPNGNYLGTNIEPAIKITEIGSEAVVAGGGVMSAVSSAAATAAVGAAIGFGVGVNWFETYPEKWTEISNAVFGTDLDPSEIGQMTRDTNALVMIKDGVTMMCEPMIDAIRDKLNELGFFDKEETYPTYEGQKVDITINKLDGITFAQFANKALSHIGASVSDLSESHRELYEQAKSIDGAYSNYEELTRRGTSHGESYRIDTAFARTANIGENVPVTLTGTRQTQYTDGSIYRFGTRSVDLYYLSASRTTYADGRVTLSVGMQKAIGIDFFVGEGSYSNATYDHVFVSSSANASETNKYPLYAPTGNVGDLSLKVKDAFPEWHNNGVDVISGVDEDGQPIYTRWLPVSLPSNNPITDGITYDQTKAQEGALPKDDSQVAEQVKTGTKDLTDNYPQVSTPTIPPTSNPTPTPPSISGGGGSATGLANLYNPTLAQVKEFSRWLWGSDGLNLDQLKKLLQDPMQAIIGLHVMYATPSTGTQRDIQVGYINSGVNSKIVTEQYTAIDCGTVTINEYFGDARDYSPFTQVYCYLPFIGIVELNADDVVNSTLGIKYKIDVLTGCCLAQLTVKKYGLDAVLYTYTGNCAVQMPITSGNYLSTVSSLLGAVVSGAAAVATGGAMAPVAIGAAANALGGGARASVAMSGSLGSNAGAMGIRKPYLIIKRVESADANGYNEFYGYPTNKRVQLSQLTGYVRVKDINLSGTNATEDEQNEIVALLREGVIL